MTMATGIASYRVFAVLAVVQISRAFSLTSITSSSSSSLTRCNRPKTSRLAAKVVKTEEEWRSSLTPDQYYVLREEGTEPPNTSPLNVIKDDGTFLCAGCNSPLFVTSTKYDSGTGWPSFYAPVDANAVDLSTDYKLVIPRTEVTCKNCGGHLGHVFEDGPQPTGQRYCMNGIAMKFQSDEENPELAEEVAQRMKDSAGIMVRPPVSSIVPNLLINGGIAAAFLNTLVHSPGNAPLVAKLIPSVGAAFYIYQVGRILVPFFQSGNDKGDD